jgi:hypothetical protein
MTVVVIGGTAGLGLEVARHYSERLPLSPSSRLIGS